MGSNLHGNNNELEIVEYLNGKKYKNLSNVMKEFINYICATKKITINDETVILSEYVTNNKKKEDLYIIIENQKFGISLKMGSGNSCHQEKIDDFIAFIDTNTNASNALLGYWKRLAWADGTEDGSGSLKKDNKGNIACRFGAKEFKQKYPNETKELQKFLNDNINPLINRAVFEGKYNSQVDFIYHGTVKNGRWISKEEILDFQNKQKGKTGRACLYLGNLTVQMWNPSISGNNEKKRGQIQIKYGQMENDFDNLLKDTSDTIGTYFGDVSEYKLCHDLNKNKNNPMWKKLLPKVKDYSDYYIVKITSFQYSSLSQRLVKTKSDAYVIKAKLSHEFLISKEYLIDENDLKNISYEIQNETGISIKMKSSKRYTIHKFTKKSFNKAFSNANINNINFWFASLLMYSNDKNKNETIISDLGIIVKDYYSLVEKEMNLKTSNNNDSNYWNEIREKAQIKIKSIIKSDAELYDNIFTGKNWFKSPYHANFIYEKGSLKENKLTDFSITTGAGRSKKSYTIIIKPN